MSGSDSTAKLTGQQVVIRDLVVSCHIGVTEAERAELQRLQVSITLEIEPRPIRADAVEEVLNYGTLSKAVRQACESNKFRLLESLAARLAEIGLADPRSQRVTIRIEKLDRYSDIAGIGVEMAYHRPT